MDPQHCLENPIQNQGHKLELRKLPPELEGGTPAQKLAPADADPATSDIDPGELTALSEKHSLQQKVTQ